MKRPGRPRIDPTNASVDVHLRLSTADYDHMCAQAGGQRVTISEWIRQSIQTTLRRDSVDRK